MKIAKQDVTIQETRCVDPKKLTSKDLSTLRNSIDKTERDFHSFRASMTDTLKRMKESGI